MRKGEKERERGKKEKGHDAGTERKKEGRKELLML